MQIVIDIPKGMYENIQRRWNKVQTEGYTLEYTLGYALEKAVLNGTLLPKGHGDLKDELDLDLFAPSLGTNEYVNDLMAKHDIDYRNGDDEDKVREFALDLICGCMNVIKTAPTIIEVDKNKEKI